ncbi:cystathionine beta-synthase [Tieghemiomyces parasiticus]|uniref:Cystathionine beta-synthase n=1 Tax=Tieghemiomyces parasiticus TaxID=78921 RepID=A0A9W7ZLH6_9FUNG|nr:cystathionine beta-synthase [Tieghemiomyces parasiticus]
MTTQQPCECHGPVGDASTGRTIPHFHQPRVPKPKIMDSILDQVGDTPLIRLNKIPAEEGLECEVLAKVEFFNPGGSVKDRIAKRMFEEAERKGIIKPGYTVIEPTSGNTGIGLALCAAVKGYRAIITMPEKMSQEKVDVLKALGAEIVRTPTEAAYDAPESHISVAKRLNEQIPNSVILDQYANPYNPVAHYDTTAEEILEACDGRIDMLVAGAGTGGTITGIAKKIKEVCPNCVVIGVDPHGSILAQPESLNTETSSYQVEGIGYDFIPEALDRSVIDEWYKSNDKESFALARRLIKEEGILSGGSSGTALAGAIHAAKRLGKGQRCVVILPDSVRNYMTKFLNDDWMRKNHFLDDRAKQERVEATAQWAGATVADLRLPQAVTVHSDTPCRQAVSVMQSNNFDQLPVLEPHTDRLVGLVTLGNVLSRVSHGKATLDSPVDMAMFHFKPNQGHFVEITPATPLSQLSSFFDHHSSALVTAPKTTTGASGQAQNILHVVTKIDLLNYLANHPSQ